MEGFTEVSGINLSDIETKVDGHFGIFFNGFYLLLVHV